MSEQDSTITSPASDKHLFLVFLRGAARDIAAVEHIRHTIQCNSFPPWENVAGGLQSNIIEATPRQTEQIASHPSVVRITRVEAADVEEDMQLEDDSTKELYIVRPTDRRDKDQCRAAHALLKDMFQDQMQPQDIGPYGVNVWKLNLTDDQVPLVSKIKGVKSPEPLVEYLSKCSETPGGKKNRIIKPLDAEDEKQCKATYATLKVMFGDHVVKRLRQNGKFYSWEALLSSGEKAQAKTIQGVLSVRTFHVGKHRTALESRRHDVSA
ncbi:hypothetical protein FGADI_5848 [Fusarium gaditjirri]|uniref:Uncharacterized protein n=1 Tax=Fusarium gaditjirri TaxID=282569 RepID=A0A8H4T922_9HYPO|nr:hypothetical protein FGADI_5848 [Fusarium gaditjirri]